ncbi:MAG: hypothetical protein JRH20_18950 [Deltaproteobacteria bacterium]|nr:hypothetical protein [Deltaproteobacteria bacterium]
MMGISETTPEGKTLRFWTRWLLVVSVLMVVLGLFMVVLGFLPEKPEGDPIIQAFWGAKLPAGPTAAFFSWMFAVWGSTMVGWGVTLFYVARYAFAQKLRWARRGLLVSLALWYPIDTLASAFFGVWFNVGLNTTFLLLALAPVVGTWRHFSADVGGASKPEA